MNTTAYQAKPTTYFSASRREMLPFVPEGVKRILEVGCSEGEFAANIKAERQVHVTGIEPFAAAARVANTRLDRVLAVDIDTAILALQGEYFDCVIVNDVLEHLLDPWETLVAIRKLLSPHGVAVASIPNVRYFPVLRALALNGRWDYADYGVLDRTHLRFFTQASIREMFETSGYCVERLEGINSMKLSWKLKILFFVFGERLVDTKYQQFACVARNIS